MNPPKVSDLIRDWLRDHVNAGVNILNLKS